MTRPAPSRSNAWRKTLAASRPSLTGKAHRPGAWAAKAVASSRCSAVPPPQCSAVNNQIAQTRANLDRVLADLQGVQGNTADREGERRNILVALGQSDCGSQYRQFANRGGGGPGGFFDSLFGGSGPGAAGPGSILTPNAPETTVGNTYRTLCVRTCDGFYFPISYSTVQSKFADDEKVCQAMCPASEVALYSHRNPGEDIAQAVSSGGRNYSELPNAFAYRKAFNPSCACKAIGRNLGRGAQTSRRSRPSSAATSSSTKNAHGNSPSRKSTRKASRSGRHVRRQGQNRRPPLRLPRVQHLLPAPLLPRRRPRTASRLNGKCAPSARPFTQSAEAR